MNKINELTSSNEPLDDFEENVEDDFENDFEDEPEEYNDLVCDDPPTWRIHPGQRITFKTVAEAIFAITIFMTVLFWINGPKAFERTSGNDLQRDGLKGPVKQVEYTYSSKDPQFAALSAKPALVTFNYDEQGNRTEEVYYNTDGLFKQRTVFTHDSSNRLIQTITYYPDGASSSEDKDKFFGLFDPIPISKLQTDDYISRTTFDQNSDHYGNWTKRTYFIRKHTLMYERDSVGSEKRTIKYYGYSKPQKSQNLFEFTIPNSDINDTTDEKTTVIDSHNYNEGC